LTRYISADTTVGLRDRNRPHHGFTLVELLVAIGVIAVLLGLLIPVVGKARQAANFATCTANLRQWALAMHEYVLSNDNCLPRRGQGVEAATQLDRDADWFNALPPMIEMTPYRQSAALGHDPDSGIWVCPEAKAVSTPHRFNYAMNMWISPTQATSPDRFDSLGDASSMAFMADGPPGHCSTVPGKPQYSPDARHCGRANICFLDGHVAAYSGAELGCGTVDPQRPDVRWFVVNSAWPGPK
jgi:prepilin-type N-terminal cleavage/methylation domain-containing protein/prepilin-type processing-associated H-X9-DG protein